MLRKLFKLLGGKDAGTDQETQVKAQLPNLISILRNDSDQMRLLAAHSALAEFGRQLPAIVVPALINALSDSSPTLRERAINLLSVLGPPPEAKPAITKAMQDSDMKVSNAAKWVILLKK